MFEKELKAMIYIADKVKGEILRIYNQDFSVEIKEDNSPVTLADKTADRLIREYLLEQFPSYGMLTEESRDDFSRLDKDYMFVVDPVDGTKDFVSKNGQFTTNIGLVYKHQVVAGVISIPAKNEMYFASKGQGAFYKDRDGKITKIHVNDKIKDLTMLISNFHTTEQEKRIAENNQDRISHVIGCGSAIKACMIAHGKAEVSFRLNPNTKEWDTAAAQIIVIEAGGLFFEPNKKEITYNRRDVYNRNGFVILNRIENLLIK